MLLETSNLAGLPFINSLLFNSVKSTFPIIFAAYEYTQKLSWSFVILIPITMMFLLFITNTCILELLYGQGVYFAADASYSAQRYLAENKPGAKRYMFLAKVLTGELIKGDPSMRGLPFVDPARPNIMYDSAVDDVDDPTQFVIFHDKQAYPKYLITYTS